MAIKTLKEFEESLRDDRVVYFGGERVKDVTKHPFLQLTLNSLALDFLPSFSYAIERNLKATADLGLISIDLVKSFTASANRPMNNMALPRPVYPSSD